MPPPADQHERDDAHEALVRCAQAYLHRRLQEVAPGSLLTLFWEEFYRFYAPVLAGMVRRSLADSQGQDDLIQEVWLAVTRKLPEFRWNENRGGLRAWFAKLVHDKTVDLIRRRQRRPTAPLDAGADPIDADSDPTRALEHRWREEVVHAALDGLRDDVGEVNFRILQLHFWENQTAAEIAPQVGLSPDQVSARQHRLLKKVRARITAYCGDDLTPMP
jgi:RNA polymerase sigma-70 factor (ECF subfamily)